MKVSITSIKFKTDKKLEQYIQEKVDKLSGLFDGLIGSEVTLRVEKNQKEDNKVTEIRLMISGNDLFAKKQSKTFEQSTDIAVEALRKQLLKHKQKIRGM
ncbi:MAG: HPF/RaiA family ribosome-associated protein [Bacteroidales bacterium]|jgi:putative sigma-54 modulation protein|nr:HPF/RaiA family ribosome-associated protein [Bacteroidales bacterium]MDD4214651.1 HPF/RaiA family ribosome-associated protein [Bacteroidales bacterium]